MEIDILRIDHSATKWDVKREIAKLLHRDDFSKPFRREDSNLREINFQVNVNEGIGGIGTHDGTGKLILPTQAVGNRFFHYIVKKGETVTVQGQKLVFKKSREKQPSHVYQTLDKTPYLEPQIEEELADKLAKLDVGIHVDKVQFGIFFRDPGDPPTMARRFSNEFELTHRQMGACMFEFEYQHKLIRIQIGNPVTDQIAHNIAIHFVNIRKMAIGIESGNPFICFDLMTPAIFQEQEFNRALTGNEHEDNRKFRKRLDSIHPGHAAVAGYAHHIRLVLHDAPDIELFEKLCWTAGLQRPHRAVVEDERRGFFTSKQLYRVRKWLLQCEFPVAFQIDALLRSGLVNTAELFDVLFARIEKLRKWNEDETADILRLFAERLRGRGRGQSLLDCLELACEGHDVEHIFPKGDGAVSVVRDGIRRRRRRGKERPTGIFPCHHVTVTPSRLVYEGPYAIQSNRVIRKYIEYPNNFIRLDFRDEDRLHLRWSRDVDGKTLLEDRVGYILKNGIEIAGRRFDFLAYSNSALREHAVWFVQPIHHPMMPFIDANVIRAGLGDFSELIREPSRYAARLGQAFTATDPSVSITEDQWEMMEDLGEEPYFTDGVGTISKALGDMIWNALCEARDGPSNFSIQPSAYQIRFLGFKGVVVVDHRLEGVKMRLRPSMEKFSIPDQREADIEIAKSFERPGLSYLNRPLITILEDRGVDISAFLDLQSLAIASIEMSSDTLMKTAELLRKHQLGSRFKLSYILTCLSALGLGTPKQRTAKYHYKDIFMDRLILVAKNCLLRDIKHSARIPVPNSSLLVGVADEGPAYIKEGVENVFCLQDKQIFVCIQEPDKEPTYLKGTVIISRSPTVHPGDVQRVQAIGKPPDGVPCFFRDLKNVVVFPSLGDRSLPSMLGGGDLDGDLYSVIKESTLLPTGQETPGDYASAGRLKTEYDITINDVCNFIVEYINSDILGVLSDRHIVIADQSKLGIKDERCMKLAELCSQAVDYPKNGIPVDFKQVPRQLIPFKPDWKKSDEVASRRTDFYESTRALGVMFRRVELTPRPPPIKEVFKNAQRPPPLCDPISIALQEHIEMRLGYFFSPDDAVSDIIPLFKHYRRELEYVCFTHSLSDSPDSRLDEEEVVIGTILATCSDNRHRKDRIFRMGLHCSVLLRDIREDLYPLEDFPTIEGLTAGLTRAWQAWDFGMRNRTEFGANSFALVALGVVCHVLEEFGDISLKQKKENDDDDEGNADSDDDGW